MPAPAPFSSPHSQSVYPALYLYPLNDSFVPKHIALLHNQRVKIGRQTNAKTAPGERNGYFDSKVLSRQHAEVWEEGNKIFIKDVKSSNGTFINGERLSPEGLESDPYELKSDDIVEFGIDIVGEDNKSIIHHKVAARVVCVFTEQDAQVAARAEQHQQHQQQYQSASQGAPSSMMNQAGPSNPNGGSASFNFAPGQQRRPQLSQQGLAGMGGMGGSMRPPGKSGLTFDHILSRLQGELQKSRETGAELHSLTGAMNEIHDALGGNMPPNLPPYPHTLLPVRPPQVQPQDPSTTGSSSGSPEQPSTIPPATVSASALTDLQTQLQDTQSSLALHVDKVRALEGVLAEQEAIKREIRALREMMETRRKDGEIEESERAPLQDEVSRGGFDSEEGEEGEQYTADEEDDAKSVNTVVPHALERVEEEDEEQVVEEERQQDQFSSSHDEELEAQLEREAEVEQEERRRIHVELGRPRTPEPMHMGTRDKDTYEPQNVLAATRYGSPSSTLSKVVASVGGATTEEVFKHLLTQVGSMMALTSSLEAQHTAAQSTITALETKVEALEAIVKAAQQAQALVPSPPPLPTQTLPVVVEREEIEEHESLTAMISEWKKSVEGQWSSVQEEWNQERERLRKAREEWEGKVRQVDSGLERLTTLQAAASAFQQQQQQQVLQQIHNGDAVKHNGLVTPPSPRSLSSDSRPRAMRRKRSGASRRSRSASRSRSGSRDGEFDTDTDTTLASEYIGSSKVSSYTTSHSYSPDVKDDDDDRVLGIRSKDSSARALVTPDSSVYKLSPSIDSVYDHPPTPTKGPTACVHPHAMNIQTAVGVLVLSAAAAAVIWRVKSE